MQLTPNQRLAIFLKGKEKSRKAVWPIHQWIIFLYETLRAESGNTLPLLLTQTQQAILWERIIVKSSAGQQLLKPANTARLAMQAWQLCIEWQIEDFPHFPLSEDNLAYLTWAQAYQELCIKKNWIDSAKVLQFLLKEEFFQKLALPRFIECVGFEELTPLMTVFLDKLRAHSVEVSYSTLLTNKKNGIVICAEDQTEELLLAANKAKQWFLHSPHQTIGIVVPDLDKRRETIVRILRTILPEGSFTVAAPIALAHYPLIKAAFVALELLAKEISLEKLSEFLRSPFFIGGQNERVERAAVEVLFREQGEAFFSWDFLCYQLEQIEKTTHPIVPLLTMTLFPLLKKLKALHKTLSGKKEAAFWQTVFVDILTTVGWPGEVSCSEAEKALIEQWETVLTNYLAMDPILKKHTFGYAVSILRRLTQETLFLPKSETASIQVLGLLEALGMPFDSLWVVGLHKEIWPRSPQPNPFIPLSLQKERGLPRSESARELKVAKHITEELSKGAKQVIFSYPKIIEETTTEISSLLSSFRDVTLTELGLEKPLSYLQHIGKIQPIAYPQDEKTLPVSTSATAGGANILKLQALCPFRAFAEVRLGAKPLPVISYGLTQSERGVIIHQILESFWKSIKTQRTLNSLSEPETWDFLNKEIEWVLKKWQAKRFRTLTPQYLLLEKERIFALLQKFIRLEKERPPFEVVAQETEKIVVLEGMQLKIRLDRLDRLLSGAACGSDVVLDYKTGHVSISDWFGERPIEPQLPLYFITHESEPAGMLLGVLRADEIKLTGIVKETDLIFGAKTIADYKRFGSESSLSSQREAWQKTLSSLMQDFKEGHAMVSPKNRNTTCRTCSLHTLCRVGSAPNTICAIEDTDQLADTT